jgi:hypothetical protein
VHLKCEETLRWTHAAVTLCVLVGVSRAGMQVWEHAYQSARHATAAAALSGHDWAFVPAAYDMLFFLAVGMPGSTFDVSEARKLLQDVAAAEGRLAAAGLKDRVLFHCATKRYLIALKKEWEKAEQAASKACAKGGKKGRRAAKEEESDVPEGHLPVTDWRVFDQRFLGYYTWLEPPLQPKPHKCENCGIVCLKVHR